MDRAIIHKVLLVMQFLAACTRGDMPHMHTYVHKLTQKHIFRQTRPHTLMLQTTMLKHRLSTITHCSFLLFIAFMYTELMFKDAESKDRGLSNVTGASFRSFELKQMTTTRAVAYTHLE